jgi:hypothetical protein
MDYEARRLVSTIRIRCCDGWVSLIVSDVSRPSLKINWEEFGRSQRQRTSLN